MSSRFYDFKISQGNAFTQNLYYPMGNGPLDARMVVSANTVLEDWTTQKGIDVTDAKGEKHTIVPYEGLITYSLSNQKQYVYTGDNGWREIQYSGGEISEGDVYDIVFSAMSSYTLTIVNCGSTNVIREEKVESPLGSINLLSGTDICTDNKHFENYMIITPLNVDLEEQEKYYRIIEDSKIDGTHAIELGFTDEDEYEMWAASNSGTSFANNVSAIQVKNRFSRQYLPYPVDENGKEMTGCYCLPRCYGGSPTTYYAFESSDEITDTDKKYTAYGNKLYTGNYKNSAFTETERNNYIWTKSVNAPRGQAFNVPSFYPIRGFYESGVTKDVNNSNKVITESEHANTEIFLDRFLSEGSAPHAISGDTDSTVIMNLYNSGYTEKILYIFLRSYAIERAVWSANTETGDAEDKRNDEDICIATRKADGTKIYINTILREPNEYYNLLRKLNVDVQSGSCEDYHMDLTDIRHDSYYNVRTFKEYYIEEGLSAETKVAYEDISSKDQIEKYYEKYKDFYLNDKEIRFKQSIPVKYIHFFTFGLTKSHKGQVLKYINILPYEHIYAFYNEYGTFLYAFIPVKYSDGKYFEDIDFHLKKSIFIHNDEDKQDGFGRDGYWVNAQYRCSKSINYEHTTKLGNVKLGKKYIYSFYAKKTSGYTPTDLRLCSELINTEDWTTINGITSGYTGYAQDSLTGEVDVIPTSGLSNTEMYDCISYTASNWINPRLADYYKRFWTEFEFYSGNTRTRGYKLTEDILKKCYFRIGFSSVNESAQPFFFGKDNNTYSIDTKFYTKRITGMDGCGYSTVCCPKLECVEPTKHSPTPWTSQTSLCETKLIDNINNDDTARISFNRLNFQPNTVKNDNLIPYPYLDYLGCQSIDKAEAVDVNHIELDSKNQLSGITFDYWDIPFHFNSEIGSMNFEYEDLDHVQTSIFGFDNNDNRRYRRVYWNNANEKDWRFQVYFDYRDVYDKLSSSAQKVFENEYLGQPKYKWENGVFSGSTEKIKKEDLTETKNAEFCYTRKKYVASSGVEPIRIKVPNEALEGGKYYILSWYAKANHPEGYEKEIKYNDKTYHIKTKGTANVQICYASGEDVSLIEEGDTQITGHTENGTYVTGETTFSSLNFSTAISNENYERYWMKFKVTKTPESDGRSFYIKVDTSVLLDSVDGSTNEQNTLTRFVSPPSSPTSAECQDCYKTNREIDTIIYDKNIPLYDKNGKKLLWEYTIEPNNEYGYTATNFNANIFHEDYIEYGNGEMYPSIRLFSETNGKMQNRIGYIGSITISGFKLEYIPDDMVGDKNVPTEWCEGSIKRYCAGTISVEEPELMTTAPHTDGIDADATNWHFNNDSANPLAVAGFRIRNNPNNDFRIGDEKGDHYYRYYYNDPDFTGHTRFEMDGDFAGYVWYYNPKTGSYDLTPGDEKHIVNHITQYFERPYMSGETYNYANAWVNPVQDFRPYCHEQRWYWNGESSRRELIDTYNINKNKQCYPLIIPLDKNIKYGTDYIINKMLMSGSTGAGKYVDLHIRNGGLFDKSLNGGTTDKTFFKVILERR